MAEAHTAADLNEVPVGAVHVHGGRGIARGRNRTVTDADPTAHAELVAIRAAAKRMGNHRIGGTIYVTLEPCIMCMGAIVQARVERVVFAATDPKAGGAVSLYQLGSDERLNHLVRVEQGPLAEESTEMLQHFFRTRRC